MKNFCRKILSLLLVLTFVLGSSLPASASTVQPRITFVATITIVSYSGGGIFSSVGTEGHSFLKVRNETSSTITVGHMTVAAGDTITLGAFGNRSAHTGIWYNIEGYYSSSISSTSSYALVTGLTSSQLTTLNTTINNNDSWTLINNCSYFARTVWNSIASSSYQVTGGNPAALVTSIKSKTDYVSNPSIPYKTLNTIARHTSTSYVLDTSGA